MNVEEGQTFGMELEFTEGMQFDKGYISPYMVTDQERMEAVLEDPYILIANQKIGSVRDMLPVLEQVDAGRQAARDHRRGRRGRGARDAGGQQAPRHLHRRRGQGPRLRRSPQADARGHRDPHRRRGDHRGDGPEAREHAGLAARPGPSRRRLQGHDDDHRRRRREGGRSRAGSTRSAPRSRTPTPTSTGRSSRSAWRSSPAASPWSRSAPPPRPR